MTTPRNRTRRDFLTRLAGLGAVLATPRTLLAERRAVLGSTRTPAPLPTRPIPGTTETLPIVGLGSSKPVLEIPTAGTDPLATVIRVLLEHGGRVVDTSPRTPEIDAEFGRKRDCIQSKLLITNKLAYIYESSCITLSTQT